MRYKIEEEDRISSMLSSDRFSNPENVLPVLRAEIQQIARDYLLLKDKVVVRYRQTDSGILFVVELLAEEVKKCGRIM